MYEIIIYETDKGNKPLKDFMSGIPNEKDLAKIKQSIKLLKSYGKEVNIHRPNTIRKIKDEIYELRPKKYRILFFGFDNNNKFILLHGFVKAGAKTPKSEKNKAFNEMKDFLRRN